MGLQLPVLYRPAQVRVPWSRVARLASQASPPYFRVQCYPRRALFILALASVLMAARPTLGAGEGGPGESEPPAGRPRLLPPANYLCTAALTGSSFQFPAQPGLLTGAPEPPAPQAAWASCQRAPTARRTAWRPASTVSVLPVPCLLRGWVLHVLSPGHTQKGRLGAGLPCLLRRHVEQAPPWSLRRWRTPLPQVRSRQGALLARHPPSAVPVHSSDPALLDSSPPFPPTQSCKSNKDCQSNQCQGSVCTFGATCNNGIKDDEETDVDCGGIDNGCLRCCWSECAASSAADCADCPAALPTCVCRDAVVLVHAEHSFPSCCCRQALQDQLRLPVRRVRGRALRRGQVLRQPILLRRVRHRHPAAHV